MVVCVCFLLLLFYYLLYSDHYSQGPPGASGEPGPPGRPGRRVSSERFVHLFLSSLEPKHNVKLDIVL